LHSSAMMTSFFGLDWGLWYQPRIPKLQLFQKDAEYRVYRILIESALCWSGCEEMKTGLLECGVWCGRLLAVFQVATSQLCTRLHGAPSQIPAVSVFTSIMLVIRSRNREYGHRDPSHWPRGTLYPQKLSLTSPTSCGLLVGIVCSWTQAMDFSLVLIMLVVGKCVQNIAENLYW
jgi:hypothetical protein